MFLIGFMASGKSTVGEELAHRLGWEFVDLDSRIEAREQKSVPAIFREQGEFGFRRAETAALQELTCDLKHNHVVALGGGAFAQERNRELLRDWPTVFLSAPPEELWRRSQEDGTERPLRKDREHFARLYTERLPFYRQATITVETAGKDVGEVRVINGKAVLSLGAQNKLSAEILRRAGGALGRGLGAGKHEHLSASADPRDSM